MERRYLVLLLSIPCLVLSCRKDRDSSSPLTLKLATAAVTNITDTSATGGGSILAGIVLPLKSLGVQVSTDSIFLTNFETFPAANSTGSFTAALTGLFPGTQYYVEAVAYGGLNGQAYGNIVTFTTSYTPGKYNVTTVAGSGVSGLKNEPSGSAEFANPDGAAVDALGNIYIADSRNNAIREITSYGAVETFATTDGSPNDVVTDKQGNVYVAENSLRILKITPGGQVSTFAGNGTRGNANGADTNAAFNSALTLSIDPAGNLYVGDGTAFRKITPAGVVTTLTDYFGGASVGHLAITVDNRYNIYETNGVSIIRIDSLGNETLFAGGARQGHTDGTGTAASFGMINEMRTDAAGNIYATDPVSDNVRMITPSGVVTTIAGTGAYGDRNGNGAQATFGQPIGLTPDNAGNIIVCDWGNNLIREISPL
jgi:sugar lactone lactonase YvrE